MEQESAFGLQGVGNVLAVGMPISSYTGGHVFTNGYIIDHEGACIVVDAPALIHEVIQENGMKPTHLLLTHQHFDHTEDVEALKEMGVEVYAYSTYDEKLVRQKEARENWGLPVEIKPFTPDMLLEGKDEVTIGSLTFKLSYIPGHSPDSVTFYCEELKAVFVGDTLMAGGMGRTDLYGDEREQYQILSKGIRERLFTLPDDTVVLSGHGEITSIGTEKETNNLIGV